MFVSDKDLANLVKGVLESEVVANPDILAQKIMDRLVQWQRETALKGSGKATHPKKRINWTTVQKQLAADVDMTTIAASQKVSEGTLRRRMKEEREF